MSLILIMEYVPSSLYDVIKNEENKLEESQIKCYVKMLLSGVKFMHKNHIMHRVSLAFQKGIIFRSLTAIFSLLRT